MARPKACTVCGGTGLVTRLTTGNPIVPRGSKKAVAHTKARVPATCGICHGSGIH